MKKTLHLTLEEIDIAAALLKKGKLVAFPTETVYGLAAPIFNPEAILSIFKAKGRPSDNPLIAHISSLAQVAQIAINIPDLFYVLAEAFFPGPLTVVLEKHPNVPSVVSAGLNTIAFRMPNHKGALFLINAVGEPLVAPSANLSGKPSSTEASHVLQDFEGKIAAVIDGGQTQYGIESTVISLLGDVPVLLRPGIVSVEAIEQVIGIPLKIASGNSQGPVHSPGMKYRHYAPATPIKLFLDEGDLSLYLEKNASRRCMLLKRGGAYDLLPKNLYGFLRLADEERFDEILIYCDEEILRDAALMNRISRAALVYSSH